MWEPRSPGAQEPTPKKVDESRFHSRIARRAKKVRLPVQDLEKWEVWCAVTKTDFQDLVEMALRFFFGESGSPGAQEPTSSDLTDQRLTDDEGNSSSDLPLTSGSPGAHADEQKAQRMLSFYSEKTGNRVRHRDRSAYARVANLSEGAIKLGIMQSVLKCRGRVNSFAYCQGAIEEAQEAGVSIEQVEYYARTFAVRLQMKQDPDGWSHEEYFDRIRQAAQQQPALPGTAGDLRNFPKGKK